MAGGVVAWRVAEARRGRRVSEDIADAVEEGRSAAERITLTAPQAAPEFEKR